MMILVTAGGFGAVEVGGFWDLRRERVVTCSRSILMMLEAQMLVMVFSSGL